MNVFTAAVEKAVQKQQIANQGSALRLIVERATQKRKDRQFTPDATRARNRAQKAADARRARKATRLAQQQGRLKATMVRITESQANILVSENPAHQEMRRNVYRTLVNQVTAEAITAIRAENPEASVHELRVLARQKAYATLADNGIHEA